MLQLLEANTSQHLWLRLHQSFGIRNFSTVGFIQLRRFLWTWPANEQKKKGFKLFQYCSTFLKHLFIDSCLSKFLPFKMGHIFGKFQMQLFRFNVVLVLADCYDYF